LTTFLDQSTTRRIVAELAAVDRISFNVIATSRQMRHAFLARAEVGDLWLASQMWLF